MKTFIFNYSHETCLASGSPCYFPRGHVRIMEHDLMPLAAFFAAKQDRVVVSDDMVSACSDFYERLGCPCNFVSFDDLERSVVDAPVTIIPWGKDARLFHSLEKAHIPHHGPGAGELNGIRNLASRQTAVRILRDIMSKSEELSLCGSSAYCTNVEAVKECIVRFGKTVLKAPWSSSGRGLRFINDKLEEPVTGWCRNIIRKQGGIVAEPFWNKMRDFACEFTVLSSGEVRYEGLSLFVTTDRCTYLGNIVASQDRLRNMLFSGNKSLEEDFHVVLSHLKEILQSVFSGNYVGPVGVDMMLCKMENDEIRIHPCVEMNVRNTMGLLAMRLERMLPAGKVGMFTMRYEHTHEDLCRYVDRQPDAQFDTDGKLVNGSLLLSPPISDTHFAAVLSVGE